MTEEQKSRLLTETQETAARLNKLNAFMATDAFPLLPREDKDLLYEQQRTMSQLVQILGKRLERAGQQFAHPKAQVGRCLPRYPGQTCHLCGSDGYACEHTPGVPF